jgi:hypothetical protein
MDLIVALTSLIDNPFVKGGQLLLSLGALWVSLWTLKRTYDHTTVEHARYFESQWQAIHQLTVNNGAFAESAPRSPADGMPDASTG